jgi:uncharacterized protein (DUF2267 family)
MLLRGLFYEGWDPTGKPTKERHEAQFLARVGQLLPQSGEAEVKAGLHAVFDVLSKKIDRGSAIKLASILPKELREYWPAFVQSAAETKSSAVS